MSCFDDEGADEDDYPEVEVIDDQPKLAVLMIGMRTPQLTGWRAWLCGLMNIFLPGCGQILGSLIQPSTPHTRRRYVLDAQLGLLQLLTLPLFLFGLLWSAWWGLLIISRRNARNLHLDLSGSSPDGRLLVRRPVNPSDGSTIIESLGAPRNKHQQQRRKAAVELR